MHPTFLLCAGPAQTPPPHPPLRARSCQSLRTQPRPGRLDDGGAAADDTMWRSWCFSAPASGAARIRAALGLMPERPLETLDPSTRVLKRAQYEAFAFSLLDGDVRVRNESHSNPANHEYRVRVVDGVPASCACPADAIYEGPCKHRVAVAIRTRILEVATKMRAVADGGRVPTSAAEEAAVDTRCDCAALDGDVPCWECVRTGRRALPE